MPASNVHIYDRAELVRRMSEGLSPSFLHFWGHTGEGMGKWVLSQWYPAPFVVDGVRYATAEHWMMSEKAKLFGDTDTRAKILSIDDPAAAKKLGRAVAGYDDAAWCARRVHAVREGSVHKFRQNEAMGELLLCTGDKVLVEAAPRDTVWGIGLGAANPNRHANFGGREDDDVGIGPVACRPGTSTSNPSCQAESPEGGSAWDRSGRVPARHVDANACVPSKWRGENLLGFALMWARDQLASEASR